MLANLTCNEDGLWIQRLAYWPAIQLHDTTTGEKTASWTIGCDGQYLVESGGMVFCGKTCYMLDTNERAIVKLDDLSDRGADVVGTAVLDISSHASDRCLIAKWSETEFAVFENGGDRIIVASESRGELTIRQEVDGLGRCGVLSSVARVADQVFCVSHVFGECFAMPAEGPYLWTQVPTGPINDPYCVTMGHHGAVILGADESRRWWLRDAKRMVEVDCIHRPDEVPVGLAAVENGYAVLVEPDDESRPLRLCLVSADGKTLHDCACGWQDAS